MSRRLWIGFEMTVMSTPPICAASSAFSMVVGGLPLIGALMLRWNCVPVNASISAGGSTCTGKSMIIGHLAFRLSSAATAPGEVVLHHCRAGDSNRKGAMAIAGEQHGDRGIR